MTQTYLKSNVEDNEAIITALNRGDETVFDDVYRYYFRGLCGFCSQYVAAAEAEEIVQDTMMWLWENRTKLVAHLTLKTLLFTIVKNKALNRISHLEIKRRVHQEIADKYESEFTSPDLYLNNELFQVYEHALSKLSFEFRQAYEMNRKENMTHKEIAQKLNVSHQTVNYRISKALKILRAELKDYLPLVLLFSVWNKFLV
ncbi:MAG: RNA polymerase sigma-70 factor [Bacteroides sp.]